MGCVGLGSDLGKDENQECRHDSGQKHSVIFVLRHKGDKEEGRHRSRGSVDQGVSDKNGRQQTVDAALQPPNQLGSLGSLLFQVLDPIGIRGNKGGFRGRKEGTEQQKEDEKEKGRKLHLY